MSWVNAVLQGILLGGLFALFACGLSLLFGVMEVINLSHGDLAVIAAYLAVKLVPATHLPMVWSFVIVVPIFVVVGYLVQRSLIQASLNRGSLTTLLVTFGLAVVIENVLLEVFSADSHSLNIGHLVSGSIHIGEQISIAYLPLVIFLVAVVVLLGLQYFLSRSTTGRLIRAVADDREAAQLAGADYRHIFGVSAAIAFATVALAGLALGMRSSFAPASGSALLLSAFEAVVIGGLGSLWGTLIGGIILGVAQAIGSQINSSYGVIAGHLVFLAVLAVRPQGITRGRASTDQVGGQGPRRWLRLPGLPLRARRVSGGHDRATGIEETSPGVPRELPADGPAVRVTRSRRPVREIGLVGVGVVVLLGALPYLVYSGTTDTLINFFILLTIASMWNLLAGYAGLVSVGQQAFVGLGAYFVLILAQHGVNPLAAIPLAAIGCGLFAVPISWLVFRLRGGYFAIATWVVADVCLLVISRVRSLGGGTGAPLPGLSGLDPTALTAYTYWAALAVTVVALAGTYLLLRSRLGLVLTAVRDNEIGARSLGARVSRAKRIVYLVAAMGTGAAGALVIVSQLNVLATSAFSVQWSAEMIFVTVIGGLGFIEGPIVGTIVFFTLQQTLAGQGAWYLIILGAVAIVVALWFPRGVWGLVSNRVHVRLFPVGYWLWPEAAEDGAAPRRRRLGPRTGVPTDTIGARERSPE
jgi:ABC-type branched-subunit amino acid transport system permease subunit